MQNAHVRRQLVDFIAELAADLQLFEHDVVHVALAYIDGFRDRVPVHDHHLLIAATACLIVASKFMDTLQEDGQPVTPSFAKVLAVLGNPEGITVKMLAATERSVLAALDWRLCVATPLLFAEAFRAKGLFSPDDRALAIDQPLTLCDQGRVWGLTQFFCNVAAEKAMTHRHGVAISAAAAIAAARSVVVETPWPAALARRFQHSLLEIQACMHEILAVHAVRATTTEGRPNLSASSDSLAADEALDSTRFNDSGPGVRASECDAEIREKDVETGHPTCTHTHTHTPLPLHQLHPTPPTPPTLDKTRDTPADHLHVPPCIIHTNTLNVVTRNTSSLPNCTGQSRHGCPCHQEGGEWGGKREREQEQEERETLHVQKRGGGGGGGK